MEVSRKLRILTYAHVHRNREDIFILITIQLKDSLTKKCIHFFQYTLQDPLEPLYFYLINASIHVSTKNFNVV